jgi:hypothetical protein
MIITGDVGLGRPGMCAACERSGITPPGVAALRQAMVYPASDLSLPFPPPGQRFPHG